jgi:hypothetical protein
MLQRRMDGVGSSEKKEKRRRRSPANGLANPETDEVLMILSDPIETRGCVSLKDHP